MRVLIRSRRPAKAQLAWPGFEPAASITVVRISTDRATESVTLDRETGIDLSVADVAVSESGMAARETVISMRETVISIREIVISMRETGIAVSVADVAVSEARMPVGKGEMG